MLQNKIIRILITEDDDGHAELITEGLRESGVLNPLQRFNDGVELWEFLTTEINTGKNEDFHKAIRNKEEILKYIYK